MRVTAKKNDGVSPVIGTILLVAITVVLVAIISAVVMGMAGDVGNTHVVGVKVAQGTPAPGASLLVTITGGDTAGLSKITVYNGAELLNVSTGNPIVGVPITIKNFTGNTNEKPLNAGVASISIVGQFSDGNQTIYTGTMNIV